MESSEYFYLISNHRQLETILTLKMKPSKSQFLRPSVPTPPLDSFLHQNQLQAFTNVSMEIHWNALDVKKKNSKVYRK